MPPLKRQEQLKQAGDLRLADEVRKLAERTGVATKEISTLVSTIQQDTGKAHASMEHLARLDGYQAMEKPHAAVHQFGREAVRKFHEGDISGGTASITQMEVMSMEVLNCLERMANAASR